MWSFVAANSEHTSMDDAEQSASWLRDEHRIIICAIISLALVVGGRTWHQYQKENANALRRARIIRLVENSRREKDRVDARPASNEEPPEDSNTAPQQPLTEDADVDVDGDVSVRSMLGAFGSKEVVEPEREAESWWAG